MALSPVLSLKHMAILHVVMVIVMVPILLRYFVMSNHHERMKKMEAMSYNLEMEMEKTPSLQNRWIHQDLMLCPASSHSWLALSVMRMDRPFMMVMVMAMVMVMVLIKGHNNSR